MNTLRTLTAAVVATFALAAYAGPFGPGAGCPAGATPGSANCPAYGAGYGPGAGNGPGAGYGPGAGHGPGAGYGQRGAGQLERFKAADKNGDGLISREEAQASLPGLAANFDAIDTNKDGNISPAELQAARGTFAQGGHGRGWQRWDADGDGKLSRAEVADAPRLSQEFDAIDTNKDGFLTLDELQAARSQFAGRGGR